MAKFSEAWSAGTGPSAPQIKRTTSNPNGGGAGLISALRRSVGERMDDMSITDELRKWAKTLTHWWYDPVKDKYTYTTGTMPPSIDAIRLDSNILAIADRIDAEHESKVSYWQGASYKDGYDEGFASADDWCAQHEDAMAEHGWVRLPKDADGEVIHVRDKLDGYGKTITVVEMRYGRSGWVLISEYGNAYADCFAFTHHHAPTVEDILCELLDKVDDDRAGQAEIIAEYADKLQFKEEA